MSKLSSSVGLCCDAFRLGREAEASALFERALDEITAVVEINPRLLTEPLQRSLAIALGCQQKRDWIGLADEIEYSIAPKLQAK